MKLSVNGKWKAFWGGMPLPAGAETLGVVTRDTGEKGALIRLANGNYVQGNAGAIRSLSQSDVETALARSEAAAALGAKGGKATSRAKRQAARENGRLGGRPRSKEVKIRVWIQDLETGEVIEELGTCITDSPNRALQMYQDDLAKVVDGGRGPIADLFYEEVVEEQA